MFRDDDDCEDRDDSYEVPYHETRDLADLYGIEFNERGHIHDTETGLYQDPFDNKPHEAYLDENEYEELVSSSEAEEHCAEVRENLDVIQERMDQKTADVKEKINSIEDRMASLYGEDWEP